MESGEHIGHRLGFPTANLHVGRKAVALPPPGVYAVTARTAQGSWPAVANLGQNPTFDDVQRELLEVHLLDYIGDLYGQDLTVVLHQFLRGEQKFPSLDALQAQLRLDIRAARDVFARARQA